jgi:exodeoxyribonuclease VII large subunit
MFRMQAARQSVKLRDGLQVVAHGDVGVYEARGQYQLIVRTLVADGVGALQREYEALKRRLSDEGLFAAERKKPIPQMPATVGLLTSPTGRRGPGLHADPHPSRLEGQGGRPPLQGPGRGGRGRDGRDAAPRRVARDLRPHRVGRGGGSIEDLWAFNEEQLVRAVAACRVPTISAVGHEIDFTLCDFAADRRAETPSAAAELISSEFVRFAERTESAGRPYRPRSPRPWGAPASASPTPARACGSFRRRRSWSAASSGWTTCRTGSPRRFAPGPSRAGRTSRTSPRGLERASPATRVEIESHRLLSLYKRLHGASPVSVLNRGFAIMRDAKGRPLTRRAGISAGQRLEAEFADGRVPLRSEGD